MIIWEEEYQYRTVYKNEQNIYYILTRPFKFWLIIYRKKLPYKTYMYTVQNRSAIYRRDHWSLKIVFLRRKIRAWISGLSRLEVFIETWGFPASKLQVGFLLRTVIFTWFFTNPVFLNSQFTLTLWLNLNLLKRLRMSAQ